jgi:Raf kinase inhibitor-like YbhB/YbcL family protein
MMSRALSGLLVAAVLVAAGCGGEKVEGPAPSAPDRIRLESPAFRNGASIPVTYTCDGDDARPPLRWSGAPADASLALLVEDPDAPGGTFVHWTIWNLPAGSSRLVGDLPSGAREGENSKGKTGWTAPCPPEDDKAHHYEFILYALSAPLDLVNGAKPDDVREAITDKALARGRLTGLFDR